MGANTFLWRGLAPGTGIRLLYGPACLAVKRLLFRQKKHATVAGS